MKQIRVVAMAVFACVTATGCFSCTERTVAPVPPPTVVQPAPVVVAPAPVVVAPPQ